MLRLRLAPTDEDGKAVTAELLSPPPSGVDSRQWLRTMSNSSQPRRESFLYKPDVLDGDLSPTRSRPSSRCSSIQDNTQTIDQEVLLVTPFAQLIETLRHARNNFMILNEIPIGCSRRWSTRENSNSNLSPEIMSDERRQRMSMETLEELEWCLDQLENLHTHKSAGQMTTQKFKRMLNRELYQFAESSKARSQVTEYITQTFLDKDKEDDEEQFGRSSVSAAASNVKVSTASEVKVFPGSKVQVTFVTNCREDASSVRLLTKTNASKDKTLPLSNQKIPKFGVETKNEEELSKQMENISKWGINIIEFSEAAGGRPLTAVTYAILQERDLLTTFQISANVLLKYLTVLENRYKSDIPYHNSLHAADVTQSSHVLLSLPTLQKSFSDLEIFATIFASAIHDVDHPGLNSQFLINSNSKLAILYNDESVLENHHLAVAFQLLQNEGCDVFINMSIKQRQQMRQLVIKMVLATDMSKHMHHLAHLKTIYELSQLSRSQKLELQNNEDRQQLLQSLVHCSDLSNPTKPLKIYRLWTDRIMEEFFRQGDKEKELGLDISPMFDRKTANVANSQVGFIDYVVRPLWETFADLVSPDCQKILDNLESNRKWQLSEMEKKNSDS